MVDNWSLNNDGIVPVGDAFRNSRLALLSSRLSAKSSNGAVKLSRPSHAGAFTLLEAGVGMSHEDFKTKEEAFAAHLSSGVDLFVEDAALGALDAVRVGVRVVTSDAASALVARNLLVSDIGVGCVDDDS